MGILKHISLHAVSSRRIFPYRCRLINPPRDLFAPDAEPTTLIMFPPCKCFFDDLSVASRRGVQCTRVISGWMTLNPYRLREHPPRPCLRRVTVKSFNPSWFDRQQTKGNSNELAWVFFKFNIIADNPHLQLYLNTVPWYLYCLYLFFLLLLFYVPVLCFWLQAASLFASEKVFGSKALSHLFIRYKTLQYPKYASSSLLPKIKSTYFFMGYFFFFTCQHIIFQTNLRLAHSLTSAPWSSQSPENGDGSFTGRLLLLCHNSSVTAGLGETRSWHICPPSTIPLRQNINRSLNTSRRMDGSPSLRINLQQIRYSNGSFLHINSCIYGDHFGNLLPFTLEICAGSLLHPWLLSSINLIWAQKTFVFFFAVVVFRDTMLPVYWVLLIEQKALFYRWIESFPLFFLGIFLAIFHFGAYFQFTKLIPKSCDSLSRD